MSINLQFYRLMEMKFIKAEVQTVVLIPQMKCKIPTCILVFTTSKGHKMVAPIVPANPPARKCFENVVGLAEFLASDISLR